MQRGIILIHTAPAPHFRCVRISQLHIWHGDFKRDHCSLNDWTRSDPEKEFISHSTGSALSCVTVKWLQISERARLIASIRFMAALNPASFSFSEVTYVLINRARKELGFKICPRLRELAIR